MENAASQADWFSCPGDSLIAAMQRRGVAPTTLAEQLPGGMRQLRDLVSGMDKIDEQLAKLISKTVGGSSNFWLMRQKNYDRDLDRAVAAVSAEDAQIWLTIPTPAPVVRGKLDQIKRCSELRQRLAFFGVGTLGAWRGRYSQERRQTRFRTSQTLTSDDGATSLWLRQAELEAALAETGPWDVEALKSSLKEIKKLSLISRPVRFLPRLKRILANVGVALVVRRAPTACKASGASRLITPERAMILMSFRFRNDEQFWFTLFHEIAHLILHNANSFIDSDEMLDDECEREANAFAASLIVPPHMKREFEILDVRYKEIMRFAVSVDVAPALVLGQLQHTGRVRRDRFTFLRRTWTWAEIDEAIATL